jgi:phosphoribosylanthranilate isomerase
VTLQDPASAVWIKICGMTTPAAVQGALGAGVDAVGFVFAASVRRVSAQRAAELARPARGKVSCIAVTRHPSQAELDEIVKVFAPDVWQSDFADLVTLHAPATLARLAVLRAGDERLRTRAARPPDGPGRETPWLHGRFLFEGPRSGAGETGDWGEAAMLAAAARAAGGELVLAGGLTPANVGPAIRRVRPFGVDVSSGVEDQPGVKSPEKIAAFAAAARAACAGERKESNA